MEVKDVNNSAAALLLNNKNMTANVAAQVMGGGFANLLTQSMNEMTAGLGAPKVSAPDEQIPASAIAKDKSERNEPKSKEIQVADKDNRKKADKPVRENAKAKASRDNESSASGVAAVDAPQKPAATEKNNAAGAVEGVVEAPAEGGQAASDSKVQAVREAFANNPEVLATLMDGEVTFQNDQLTPSELLKMGSVQVMDLNSGEIVTMSGAELLQKITPTTITMVPNGTPEPFLPSIDMTAPVLPGVMTDTKATVAKQPEMNTANLGEVVYNNAELAAQAAALDEVVAPETKLDVKVSVHEEKIAYTGTTDLIKDKLTLDSVLRASAAEGKTNSSAATSNATSSASTPSLANNTLNQNAASSKINFNPAAAVQNVAQNVEVEQAVAEVRLAAASEVNGASLARAGSAGSEFVNAAKADAAAKPADNTLRETLKGMSKEVVEQVKINITKSAVKGVDKIDISLKPEELGHIEIKMQIAKDGKLQAHIITSRPETMEVLQKEVQNLEQAFNDAGFSTDADSLSFSYRDSNQAGAGSENKSELRDFIGNVFANETGDAGNDNSYYWDPSKGLNIRV